MVYKVRYCDGKLFTSDILKKMLSELNEPIVFQNLITDWSASKWTINEFTTLFGRLMTKFKIFTHDIKDISENLLPTFLIKLRMHSITLVSCLLSASKSTGNIDFLQKELSEAVLRFF